MTRRQKRWHHTRVTRVGDSPVIVLVRSWNSRIDNLIVYILKVLRSISTGNPAKVSHFIFPPTSFYISLQQFCGKGRTYNTSFSRKLLFFQNNTKELDFDYFVSLFEEYYLSDDPSDLGNFINGRLEFPVEEGSDAEANGNCSCGIARNYYWFMHAQGQLLLLF